MKVITIPGPSNLERRLYRFDSPEEEQKYTAFVPGIKVLPSEHYQNAANLVYTFIRRHEHGERFWDGGGYECYDSTGAKRAFYLDALIIHPDEFRGEDVSVVVVGAKRRGRKRTKEQVIKDPNAPKGKRGRKCLSPELKAIRDAEKAQSKGKPRGRRKMDPALRKTKPYVKKEGSKRGRPVGSGKKQQ